MSQPSVQGALSDLPATIARLTSSVPAAARAVTAASVDMWAPDARLPVIATLRRVQFDWRIHFSKDQTQTILFFIHIPEGQFVMLDATASITILGAWDLEPTDALAAEDIQCVAQFPVFLNLNPTNDFVNTYKPVGADGSKTIFFALGEGGQNVLAVANPDQGQKAQLRYSPGGVPGDVPKKGFPLAAFVDLSCTLRDWVTAGAPMGQPVAVLAAGSQQPGQQILSSFVDAYARSVTALRADTVGAAPLDQRFRVAGYSVSMKVALAQDGSIPQSKDEQKSLLSVTLTGSAGMARATLASPDFIVSGDLYDEIFGALNEERQAAQLGEQIDKDGPAVVAFCASARVTSAIFNLGEDEGAMKLLMVLSGVMIGFAEIVVVRADYNDGFFQDFLVVEEFDADISNTVVSYDDVGQWFLPLIAGIRYWVNELLTW